MKKLRGKAACMNGVSFTVKWDAEWGMPVILANGDVPTHEQIEWIKAACEARLDMRSGTGAFKTALTETEPIPGGFVYVIRNLRSGLVKIGFSKRPHLREKTLQSQEPELETLALWSGTTKDERRLHLRYAAQRVRGEWFKLSEADIASIASHLTPVTYEEPLSIDHWPPE